MLRSHSGMGKLEGVSLSVCSKLTTGLFSVFSVHKLFTQNS